jgi:hypothetical protein
MKLSHTSISNLLIMVLVYCSVPFIFNNPYPLFYGSSGRNSVTVQNRAQVYMKYLVHKNQGMALVV